MATTLKDLFRGSDKDISRTADSSRLRSELTGLRTSEFLPNIPSLYGTDAIRITDQRTNLTTEMRESRTGTSTDGGLVGRGIEELTGGRASSLTELGRYTEDKLGIPKSLIPTRIITNDDFIQGKEQDTMITLANIRDDATGTQVGRFLRESGGGTPNQIISQNLGNLLNVGKDFARNIILGSRTTLNPNNPDTELTGMRIIYNSGPESYTSQMTGYIQSDSTLTRIPSDADPDIPENFIRNFTLLNRQPKRGERSTSYYQDQTFRDSTEDLKRKTRDNVRHLFRRADGDDENDYSLDSILVKIGSIRFNLATITGISETFNPSWDGSNMIGNPFSQYTYTSISRELSFGLKMYSMNPQEHREMWTKLERLGKLTYPLDYQDTTGFIKPPVTNLTIGSLYKNKFGFISSLSYAVDDNGGWDLGFGSSTEGEIIPSNPIGQPLFQPNSDGLDTAGKKWKLPKIIDVSISFQFIESRSDVDNQSLYTFDPIT